MRLRTAMSIVAVLFLCGAILYHDPLGIIGSLVAGLVAYADPLAPAGEGKP